MKTPFTILFIALTLISCVTKLSEKRGKIEKTIKLSIGDINLKLDTFDISVDGDLTKAVVFHGNYYLMFETNRKNTTQRFKNMIVLDKKGNLTEKVFVPDEFKNIPYYDISVENDSLFIKETEFEEYTFVLDEKNSELKSIKRRKLKAYQDSNYNIYTMDHGEWGGTTYFHNKTTDAVYSIEYLPNAINRIDSTYYLMHSKSLPWGHSSLLKIEDPKILQRSNLNFISRRQDKYLVGGEVLFQNADIDILCSFVLNKKLLHIYSVDNKTYLGEINANRIHPLYKFDFQFSAFQCMHYEKGMQIFSCFIHDQKHEKWVNSSFMPFDDDDNQKPVYNKGAIMIIDGDNITFHVLN